MNKYYEVLKISRMEEAFSALEEKYFLHERLSF